MKIAKYVVGVFTVCVLIIFVIFNSEKYSPYVTGFFKVLSPVIWGGAIAYVLNPLMKLAQNLFKKADKKGKLGDKLLRGLAIFSALLVFLGAFALLLTAAVPEIVRSIEKILGNFSVYMSNLEKYFNTFMTNNPGIDKFFVNEFSGITNSLRSLVLTFQPQFEKFLSNLGGGAFSFLIGVKDFLIGIIVSVYLLFSKEIFIGQIKKFVYALLPNEKCDRIFETGRTANKMFSGYIAGSVLDSIIVGFIVFILLTICRVPFAVLVSCIVAVMNMIPFFGPFIGGIPCALLILVEDFGKGILFIVLIVIVQQLDGNILAPRILGERLGLPPLWIVVATLIGGGLFNFVGLVLSAPVFAVIYGLTKTYVNNKLGSKNLSKDSAVYTDAVNSADVKNVKQERTADT
jgi:predicted PurR-regulated permease PerM